MIISELEQQVATLDREIEYLKSRRDKLCGSLAAAKSAFKVGDVITWVSGWGLRKGRVVKICSWHSGAPKWSVRSIRQDGSEGQIFEVCDYHDPELATLLNEPIRPMPVELVGEGTTPIEESST